MSQSDFIIFVTDDQVYGDLSRMGSTDFVTSHFVTSHLD